MQESNSRRELECLLASLIGAGMEETSGDIYSSAPEVEPFKWHAEDRYFVHNKAVQGQILQFLTKTSSHGSDEDRKHRAALLERILQGLQR